MHVREPIPVYVLVCATVHTFAKTVCVCVCMRASQLVCSLIKHTPLVCALRPSLFSCPENIYTHTHMCVCAHTGWHLGWHLYWQRGTCVWDLHKEAESCNPDPSLGVSAGFCVCASCVSSRDTVVVLSGLRNSMLQPCFPLSLALHATVTARQLALRPRRGAPLCVCACACVHVCFLCDWVCSNVA